MPELPEVETVVRQLRPKLEGREISELKIYDKKRLKLRNAKFSRYKIVKVFRKGKYIVLSLSHGSYKPKFLAVHLRMTGRLICFAKNEFPKPSKHTRADFFFKSGELMRFLDVRRFGTLEEFSLEDEIGPNGFEPLEKEFNSKSFSKLVFNSKQPIKTFLLRQDKILGLGNIYVSEILYKSKVLPTRLGCELTEGESKEIVKNTKSILKKAINNCGTTFSDFQQTTGEIGSYQNFLKVYGRQGESCKKCSFSIEKTVQAGRSSFYCLGCQV